MTTIRPTRISPGQYVYRGLTIDRIDPAGPSYPWIVTWADGGTSDAPRLEDAVRLIDNCPTGRLGLHYKGNFDISEPEAYNLVLAALELVSKVTPSVHRRCRAAMDRGEVTADPSVRGDDLVRLVDALEALEPGMADGLIMRQHAARLEAQEFRRKLRREQGATDA